MDFYKARKAYKLQDNVLLYSSDKMSLINKLKGAVVAGAIALSSLLPMKAEAQTLSDKINPFKQPNQSKSLIWDTLFTRAQREDLLKHSLEEDSTNHIPYDSTKFISGNFAVQLNLN